MQVFKGDVSPTTAKRLDHSIHRAVACEHVSLNDAEGYRIIQSKASMSVGRSNTQEVGFLQEMIVNLKSAVWSIHRTLQNTESIQWEDE